MYIASHQGRHNPIYLAHMTTEHVGVHGKISIFLRDNNIIVMAKAIAVFHAIKGYLKLAKRYELHSQTYDWDKH